MLSAVLPDLEVIALVDIRILIAEKDINFIEETSELLEYEGYEVQKTFDGISVIKLLRRNEYDILIICDDLPELDGINVCRQARIMSESLILMLSEKADEISALKGYETGADDYIVKPVFPRVLTAKVKALLKRITPASEQPVRKLIFGSLCIDTIAHKVYIGSREIALTPKEYRLLLLLASNSQKVFSRQNIIDELWGDDYFGTDRTVDTHIKTLRQALAPKDGFIATVRGFGYTFREDGKTG